MSEPSNAELLAPVVADVLGRWLSAPARVLPLNAHMPTAPIDGYGSSIYVRPFSRKFDQDGVNRFGSPWTEGVVAVGYVGFGRFFPDIDDPHGGLLSLGGGVRRRYAVEGLWLYLGSSNKPPRCDGALVVTSYSVRAARYYDRPTNHAITERTAA